MFYMSESYHVIRNATNDWHVCRGRNHIIYHVFTTARAARAYCAKLNRTLA